MLLSIERRHYEQVKTAVPGVLEVLKAFGKETDDEIEDVEHLFSNAIRLASSIEGICVKMVSGSCCQILFS